MIKSRLLSLLGHPAPSGQHQIRRALGHQPLRYRQTQPTEPPGDQVGRLGHDPGWQGEGRLTPHQPGHVALPLPVGDLRLVT